MSYLYLLLIGCPLITSVLLVWFKTEAWHEYSKLFHIATQLAKNFETEQLNDMTITYIQFLRKNYHQHFIIRLITCPICLSFWLATCLALTNIIMFAPLMVGGLILYGCVCKLLDI